MSPTDNTYLDLMRLGFQGELASCESCVESRRVQDHQDAKDFLEAGAEAGVFERTFLLDLYGRLGPRATFSDHELVYDEPVYLSAPRYRMKNGDRRQTLARAREAIREAIRLYTEELSSDDAAIRAAYEAAIEQELISGDDVPPEGAKLSAIAMLRSIVRAFRKGQGKDASPEQAREIAQDEAVNFIRSIGPGDTESGRATHRPASRELEDFVIDALRDPGDAVRKGIVPEGAEARYIRAAIGIAERLYCRLEGAPRSRFAAAVQEAFESGRGSDVPARQFAKKRWSDLVAPHPIGV
ncbi:MAG: hypothetical protein ACE5GX_07430 [Thermoanaerobaculia bacterium]